MKTFLTLALALVLTAAALVGCGCTNRNSNMTTPTVLPTNEEMWNTTEAPTRHTTEATTGAHTTEPTGTRETIDNGNGGIDDTLNPTTATDPTASGATEGALEGRARRIIPGTR